MDKENPKALQAPIGGSQVELSPSRAVPIVQPAPSVTIHDGNFVRVGGNISIQNLYHTYAEHNLNLASFLHFVRNLRVIHQDVLSKATPGTGVWLLKTKTFALWLDPNGDLKILWGVGIPGAGKTVMASIVIDEIEARAAAAGGKICVCYVYFRYSDTNDLTLRSILEILVKQTVERHPDCASLAEETYTRHVHENTQPTEAELLQLLSRFTGRKLATFYVLDALDEAPDKLQLELIKKLASLNIRLFITSRPLTVVESRLSGVHSFPIVARMQDIQLHIDREIERSTHLQGLLEKAGPSLRQEVVSSIKKNCDGMFLHASLQLEALCECLNLREVKRTLEDFPSNIEEVYLQTWNRILKRNPSRVLLAKAVLLWVLNASRSMTLEELERAVATSPETYEFIPDKVVPGMSLVALCRGLVTFEEESRAVRLVHYTAKGTLRGLLLDSFPHPQRHLAAVCTTHLLQVGFQNTSLHSAKEFSAARQADPLLAYASDAWATHARESLDAEESRRRTRRFIKECQGFPAFTNPGFSGYFDILSPLHILAIYDLPISLIAHDDIGDPNVVTRIKRKSPLRLASWHGNEGAVASLLACPDTLVNLVDDKGWSALMLAARYGHKGVTKVMLACPETQVNLVDGEGWSALMKAASNGHEGIVQLLLARGETRVNLVDNDGWSALMKAARNGHEGIAALLLARLDTQVNLADNKGWSALMKAAGNGHEAIVKLLLAHPKIEVNLVDAKGWSALMLAARFGRKGIVKLLLARPEVQVNLVDSEGWSSLMKAAGNGHEDTVKLLIARPDIMVNLVDNRGSSALILSAASGYEGVAKILLVLPEIQVNLADHKGWSALMLAAKYGHICIIKLLLGHPEIQINSVDSDGWSALMLAARYGHEGIIKLLLARTEIQVNLIDSEGWSALMKAAGNGHTAIVELLLACPNIQINLVDNKGWSALMKAARYGHEAITKLLLARPEIQVNLVDSNGSSALSLAAYGGHTTIVGLLLARPHISTATRRLDDWETAMSVASDNGHMEIVQLLREIELRQAGSDPQDSSTGTVTDQEQLALEEPVDAEVRSGYDSEDSQPYHDAEEWLEVDGVVYA